MLLFFFPVEGGGSACEIMPGRTAPGGIFEIDWGVGKGTGVGLSITAGGGYEYYLQLTQSKLLLCQNFRYRLPRGPPGPGPRDRTPGCLAPLEGMGCRSFLPQKKPQSS